MSPRNFSTRSSKSSKALITSRWCRPAERNSALVMSSWAPLRCLSISPIANNRRPSDAPAPIGPLHSLTSLSNLINSTTMKSTSRWSSSAPRAYLSRSPAVFSGRLTVMSRAPVWILMISRIWAARRAILRRRNNFCRSTIRATTMPRISSRAMLKFFRRSSWLPT